VEEGLGEWIVKDETNQGLAKCFDFHICDSEMNANNLADNKVLLLIRQCDVTFTLPN